MQHSAQGDLAGFPVIALRATLIDGWYHETDSSMLTFEIAARAALREALQKVGPILLEPVVHIEISIPDVYVDRIIRDLMSRRGQIEKPQADTEPGVIRALVPAANLFGYANSLRSMSEGRANYVSRFDHYAAVPGPDDPRFRPAAALHA
jgi:elongation factor G